MSDVQRWWVPSKYMDNIAPSPRLSPSAWVELTKSGPALALNDDYAEPGTVLREGEVVAFHWWEDHGRRTVTFHATDGGRSWTLDGDEPKAPEGGRMIVAERGSWAIFAQSLPAFVAAYDHKTDGAEVEVIFYAWALEPTDFAFRDGRFVPVESGA